LPGYGIFILSILKKQLQGIFNAQEKGELTVIRSSRSGGIMRGEGSRRINDAGKYFGERCVYVEFKGKPLVQK